MNILDSLKWFFIQTVHADTNSDLKGLPFDTGTYNTTSNDWKGTLTDLISRSGTSILGVMLLIAGVLAVLFIIWSGIQYITSAGSPDKAKAARTGVINGVIGVIIVVAAYAFIRLAIQFGNFISTNL